ncbi:MAG: CoA transferase [Candidatus Rokubacteria bacterium]|nr:CoA transferase [Candidatus Rokubacteria bacterium]
MTPLDGIRVVDCSGYIAGAYAGMMLADLGATVVKVEPLEGEAFRELPGFYAWNRGKRSIALNLKAPEGIAVVEKLVREGDVFLENMRAGVADRLGLGWEKLSSINPRLVYCSVTAFGSTGPYKDRPGFDPLLQAMSGMMALQGFGGPPQYLRIAVNDYYTASLAAQAMITGLFVRERTGRGQRVETSLLHGSLSFQSGNTVEYAGKPTGFRPSPAYRLYQAGDDEWFFLACGNQVIWVRLCGALGLSELAHDPRFASWMLRNDNAAALMPLLEERFRTKPRDHWLALLAEHDVPAAAVQTLAEFMAHDPAVRHHDLVREYDHPEVGTLRMLGQPVTFSETPLQDPGRPPTLGEHTEAILHDLGYDDDAIASLRTKGVLRKP